MPTSKHAQKSTLKGNHATCRLTRMAQMIAQRGAMKRMTPMPLAPAATPAADTAVIAQQRARLDELAAHLANADACRGAEVYRSGNRELKRLFSIDNRR